MPRQTHHARYQMHEKSLAPFPRSLAEPTLNTSLHQDAGVIPLGPPLSDARSHRDITDLDRVDEIIDAIQCGGATAASICTAYIERFVRWRGTQVPSASYPFIPSLVPDTSLTPSQGGSRTRACKFFFSPENTFPSSYNTLVSGCPKRLANRHRQTGREPPCGLVGSAWLDKAVAPADNCQSYRNPVRRRLGEGGAARSAFPGAWDARGTVAWRPHDCEGSIRRQRI
jgi:hypothetical protein